ncbi:MAG: endonuclease/exonuclease/phosphatase family protein [Rubrobacteraceae bacterium]
MTFNIRGSYHGDGENSWERRAGLNLRVIKRYFPDVICFQELQAGNRETYDKELPGYEYVTGPEYENRKPHAYNAIYWNPRRMKLLETGGFWLSASPEKFSASWNTAHVRSANWARFRFVPSGLGFVLLNTHLDHKSPQARQQAANLIVRRLGALDDGRGPVFVTGDFNTDPGSPVHDIFGEAGFEDAHLLANNPPTRTFHKFRGEDFIPRKPESERRIDWVLLRDAPTGDGLRASHRVRCQVIRDAEPPIYPGDHYPVIVDLSAGSTGAKAI